MTDPARIVDVEVVESESQRRRRQELQNRIESAEAAVRDAEDELTYARQRLEELEDELKDAAFTWPDRQTLLAVYGAPGNWPVAPA